MIILHRSRKAVAVLLGDLPGTGAFPLLPQQWHQHGLSISNPDLTHTDYMNLVTTISFCPTNALISAAT